MEKQVSITYETSDLLDLWEMDKTRVDDLVARIIYELSQDQTFSDLFDFIEFSLDHLEHFNAIPCEFETESEDVWDTDKCWETAKELGLTKKILDF